MTVVEPRTTRKDWQAILARVETAHPVTKAPEWARLLDNTDVMAAIIRDLIVIDRQPARRGARPLPEYEEGRRRLQALFGEDFSVHSFAETFQALTRDHSRTQIARRTGIARTRVHRLLTGLRYDATTGETWTVEPTLEEITAIAAAYNRRPEHFREYRTRLITALVAHHLDEHPERSSLLVQQLAAGQAG
jgi:hypothetical protein